MLRPYSCYSYYSSYCRARDRRKQLLLLQQLLWAVIIAVNDEIILG